jgi:hypothetical protein
LSFWARATSSDSRTLRGNLAWVNHSQEALQIGEL